MRRSKASTPGDPSIIPVAPSPYFNNHPYGSPEHGQSAGHEMQWRNSSRQRHERPRAISPAEEEENDLLLTSRSAGYITGEHRTFWCSPRHAIDDQNINQKSSSSHGRGPGGVAGHSRSASKNATMSSLLSSSSTKPGHHRPNSGALSDILGAPDMLKNSSRVDRDLHISHLSQNENLLPASASNTAIANFNVYMRDGVLVSRRLECYDDEEIEELYDHPKSRSRRSGRDDEQKARRSTKRRARKEADSIGEVVQEISSQDSPIKNNANPQTTNSSSNTVIMTGKSREVLGPSRKGGVSHQRRKSMPKQVYDMLPNGDYVRRLELGTWLQQQPNAPIGADDAGLEDQYDDYLREAFDDASVTSSSSRFQDDSRDRRRPSNSLVRTSEPSRHSATRSLDAESEAQSVIRHSRSGSQERSRGRFREYTWGRNMTWGGGSSSSSNREGRDASSHRRRWSAPDSSQPLGSPWSSASTYSNTFRTFRSLRPPRSRAASDAGGRRSSTSSASVGGHHKRSSSVFDRFKQSSIDLLTRLGIMNSSSSSRGRSASSPASTTKAHQRRSSSNASLVRYPFPRPDALSTIAEVNSGVVTDDGSRSQAHLSKQNRPPSTRPPQEVEAAHLAAKHILEQLMQRVTTEAAENGAGGEADSVDSQAYRQAVRTVVRHDAVRIAIQFVNDRFYTDSLKIAAIGLNVLRRISIDPLARAQMVDNGVVAGVSEVIRTHFKVQAVLDDGIHILHALVADDDKGAEARKQLPPFVLDLLKHARLRLTAGSKTSTLCNHILEGEA